MPDTATATPVKKYRPSNGTEGECFQSAWCSKCVHDDPENGSICPIHGDTMAYSISDPEYPDAWRYNEEGVPICTKFSAEEGAKSPVPTDADKKYQAWLAERDGASNG